MPKAKVIILSCVLAPFAFIAIFFALLIFNLSNNNVDWSPLPFNSQLWQAPRELGYHPYGFPFIFFGQTQWHYSPVESTNRQDPTRYRMLKSLEKNHKLVGMTTTQILKLLGPAGTTETFHGHIEGLGYSVWRPGGFGELSIEFQNGVAVKSHYSPGEDDVPYDD